MGCNCCQVILPEETQDCAYMRDVQPWHSWQLVRPLVWGLGMGMRQVHVCVVTGSLFEETRCGLLFHSLIKKQAARKT